MLLRFSRRLIKQNATYTMELGEPFWNVVYAAVSVGAITVVAMMSTQFQEGNIDTEDKPAETSAVNKIMQKAKKSYQAAERQRDSLKAAVLAQDSLSLVSSARMIASDEEIEQKSKIYVRELAQDARAVLRKSIDSIDSLVEHADNLMRAVQQNEPPPGRR